MTVQTYVMFFGGIGLLLINFFVKHWVLNFVIMLLMIGVMMSPGINEFWQYGLILVMAWQFLEGFGRLIGDYL